MGLMEQLQQQQQTPSQWQPQQPSAQSLGESIQMLRRLARGDTQALVSTLASSNPDFARFMAANGGKTPQQAFADYGLDLGEIIKTL